MLALVLAVAVRKGRDEESKGAYERQAPPWMKTRRGRDSAGTAS